MSQLGMAKHRKSGHSGISPKLRHRMKREAELEENDKNKKKTKGKMYSSVKELFNNK